MTKREGLRALPKALGANRQESFSPRGTYSGMDDEMRAIRKHTDEELGHLASKLMRQQATLSLKVAFVFVTLLILLPLFNLFFPSVANMNVGGFTLTWLVLGVLFFPITWILSQFFVKQSDQIDADEAASWAKDLEGPL